MKVILGINNGEDTKIDGFQLMNDERARNMVNVQSIDSILKATDITFALPYYKQDPESKNKLINLQDNGSLNMINSKYFEKNPLELNKL